MDLLKAIRRIQVDIRTKISFYHIYGHQDKITPLSSLSREAQLNVYVDRLAQTHLDESYITSTFHHNPIFPKEGWFMTLGGVKIVDGHRKQVRNWIGRS